MTYRATLHLVILLYTAVYRRFILCREEIEKPSNLTPTVQYEAFGLIIIMKKFQLQFDSWIFHSHGISPAVYFAIEKLIKCSMRMRYQLCSSVDVERCNDRSSWRSIMASCLAPKSSSLFKENFTDSADVW